jgi:hypothetical protein
LPANIGGWYFSPSDFGLFSLKIGHLAPVAVIPGMVTWMVVDQKPPDGSPGQAARPESKPFISKVSRLIHVPVLVYKRSWKSILDMQSMVEVKIN